MNKVTTMLLLFLAMPVFLPGALAAAECPDLDRDLARQLLRNSNYQIPDINTLSPDLQAKISEKLDDHCLYLAELDPEIGVYGVLLQEKNTSDYHLFHAVKCSCNGAKPFRVLKMAEFSGDIPIISPRPQNLMFVNVNTGEEIDLGSAWKTIFVELLGSGEKNLYRRKNSEVLQYKVE